MIDLSEPFVDDHLGCEVNKNLRDDNPGPTFGVLHQRPPSNTTLPFTTIQPKAPAFVDARRQLLYFPKAELLRFAHQIVLINLFHSSRPTIHTVDLERSNLVRLSIGPKLQELAQSLHDEVTDQMHLSLRSSVLFCADCNTWHWTDSDRFLPCLVVWLPASWKGTSKVL